MEYSVVIPAFNAQSYLADCIESVSRQTLPPKEIVCIDDGSTDDTSGVALRYPHVTLIRQENQGVSAARNQGLRVTTSPVIAFCDADDVWAEHKMELQMSQILNGNVASYCGTEEFVSDVSTMDGIRQARTYCLPLSSCVVVRRTLIDDVGLFDEGIFDVEFVEWWTRVIAKRVAVARVDAVLVRRRIHGHNKSRMSYRSPAEFLDLVRRHRNRLSRNSC